MRSGNYSQLHNCLNRSKATNQQQVFLGGYISLTLRNNCNKNIHNNSSLNNHHTLQFVKEFYIMTITAKTLTRLLYEATANARVTDRWQDRVVAEGSVNFCLPLDSSKLLFAQLWYLSQEPSVGSSQPCWLPHRSSVSLPSLSSLVSMPEK